MAARHAGGGRRYPAKYRALAGFIVASAAFVAIFVTVTLSAFHKPTPHGVPGTSTFAATSAPVDEFCANQTWPIPPRPSGAVIS